MQIFRRTTVMLVVLFVVLAVFGCAETTAERSPAAEIAATIGDRQITLEELDEQAMALDMKPYQALYDARRAALEKITEDELLTKEAESRGIAVTDLLASEVTQKVTPIADAQVEAFYNQNEARMGGQPLDVMRPRILEFLNAQNAQVSRQRFIDGLKANASIAIEIQAPRIDVVIADNDPAIGPADAPVTIVEFSDFQCPYCQRVGPTMESIKKAYGDKVRIVFRDYPLSFHQQALPAAAAAQCAHEQGKFWEYHDKLFANQKALANEDLKRYATELELDGAKFNECVDTGRYRQDVTADFEYGSKVGVSGTPAFFINGRFLNGAQPFEKFKEIIDEELASTS